MSDLISRAAAIDAVGSMLRRKFGIGGDLAEITLAGLPSAQPKIEERKEESAQNVPKEDLISRKAAIEEMTSGVILVTNNNVDAVKKVMELFIDKIKNLPSVEPERKTARWIHKGGGSFICSDCGEMVGLNTYRSERAGEIFLYCPHCGARMKGDENETD